MAYRPGQYVREFFTQGGFTLTDKSPKYGPGKIPLFKSLTKLNRKELLYAVGYNLSTLGAFGIDAAALGAMPYLIGQYTNTINSFRKNLKNPSNVLGGQIVARQKLLGGARLIGKMRPAVQRSLKTNTPFDRATNIIVGRETAGMLKMAREAGATGTIVNLIQEVNPRKMDNQLLKQAEMPNKGNVFTKWRDRTFAEAYMNAPDPFSRNPIMQMRKQQAKREAARAKRGGRSRTYGPDRIGNIDFSDRDMPVNIDHVLKTMSLADDGFLGGRGGGRQKSIADALDSAIANKKYANDGRIMGMSQKARNELYRQNEYNRAGRLLSFAQTRTYADRGVDTTLLGGRNPLIRNADGTTERDVRGMASTQQVDTRRLRDVRQGLRSDFDKAGRLDLSNGNVPPNMFLDKDGMESFRNFLHAFGMSTANLTKTNTPAQASRLMSAALTMISGEELTENMAPIFRQQHALRDFSKVLIDQGYFNLGEALRTATGNFRDNAGIGRAQGAYLKRKEEIDRLKSMNRDGQMVTALMITKNPSSGIADVRFRPSGSFITGESDYLKEVLAGQKTKSILDLKTININDKGRASGTLGKIHARNITDNPLSKTGMGTNRITYMDLLKNTPDDPVYVEFDGKNNPKIKSQFFGEKGTRKVLGQSESWWNKKLNDLHKNYRTVAKNAGQIALFEALHGSPGKPNRNIIDKITKQIKQFGGNSFDKNEIYEYLIGEFERFNKGGKHEGAFFEKRGMSTISNPAMEKEGMSTKHKTSHNYVPIKAHIQKSIFMHRMDRKGVNENDGTQFLFRYRVSAGGKSPKSKYADGIRDIFSIEYGGLLHDRNYQLEKRTDGMFVMPSFFMGKAGTRSAAFFGIFDTGSQFKAKGPGGMGTFSITNSVDGVTQTRSPYDISIPGDKKLGRQKYGVRKNLKKDERSLKKTRRQGMRRIVQLERDFDRVLKNTKKNGGFVTGAQSVEEARLAQQRALRLYRNSGNTGIIPGQTVFKQMDNVDRDNLGIVGNDIADNAQMRLSSMGFYQNHRRQPIGEFRQDGMPGLVEDGLRYEHAQGSAVMHGNFMTKNGETVMGEMPIVQATDQDFLKMEHLFSEGVGADKRINYSDMAKFTGIPKKTLEGLRWEMSTSPNKLFLEKSGLNLETRLNPTGDPKVKKILQNPFAGMSSQFDLHKINGPFLTQHAAGPRVRNRNAPTHPVNQYNRIFNSDKIVDGLYHELKDLIEKSLTDVINTADKGTKQIIRKAIQQGATHEIYIYRQKQNALLYKNVNWMEDEGQFRQLLLGQAYALEKSKIRAQSYANSIKKRYQKEKLLSADVYDEFYNKGIPEHDDWKDLHHINTVPVQSGEGGFEIHLIFDSPRYANYGGTTTIGGGPKVVKDHNVIFDGKGKGQNMTALQTQLENFYNPDMQQLRDFAGMGSRGIDKIDIRKSDTLSSYYRGTLRRDLENDPILRSYYTEHFGDDVINEFMKGRYAGYEGTINDIIKGEHLMRVDGGIPTVVNTTSVQSGQSVQELYAVGRVDNQATMVKTQREINKIIFNDGAYRNPTELGKLFWKGARAEAELVNPQSVNKRLAEILHDGTASGYFKPGSAGNRDRADFIKSVWHNSFRVRTNLRGGLKVRPQINIDGSGKITSIHGYTGYDKAKYKYGVHSKTLDLIKTPEGFQVPDEFILIQNAWGQLGIDIGKKRIQHNTIKDIPALMESDYHNIARLLMQLYPTATATSTMYGASMSNVIQRYSSRDAIRSANIAYSKELKRQRRKKRRK